MPDHDELSEEDIEWFNEWEIGEVPTASMQVPTAEQNGHGPAPLAEDATYLDKLRYYLLDSAGLDRLRDPEPLVAGILYLDTLAWLIGRPGHGKSLVGLDWAGHIGTGQTWNGCPVTSGPVLYVSPEAPSGIKLRVRAWEEAMGVIMDQVYFLPIGVQASNAMHWDALIDLCREIDPVLVVLDTQARVTVGLEENSAKDMGQFVDRVERLRAATKACVLIVHHTTRGSSHLRGSTALEGAASTIVVAVKDGDQIRLTSDPDEGGKSKDVAPFDPLTLRLIPTGSSVILAPVDLGRDQLLPSTPTAGTLIWVREWWQVFGSDWVTKTQLVTSEVVSERSFYRAKSVLVEAGLLEVEQTGRSSRYRLLRAPL